MRQNVGNIVRNVLSMLLAYDAWIIECLSEIVTAFYAFEKQQAINFNLTNVSWHVNT